MSRLKSWEGIIWNLPLSIFAWMVISVTTRHSLCNSLAVPIYKQLLITLLNYRLISSKAAYA